MHLIIIFAIPTWLAGCRNCPCSSSSSNPTSTNLSEDASGLVRTSPKRQSFKDTFYSLVRVMGRGTFPPMWIAKMDLTKYMDKAKVYYDGSLDAAAKLATQREPCRINGQRLYDEEKFRELFGYSRAQAELPDQNIAIFTKTPVRLGPGEFVDINVLSVTWPNLADTSLPDYEILRNHSARRTKLEEMFKRVFSKIATVGNRQFMEKIVVLESGLDESIQIASKDFGLDMVEILNKVSAEYLVKDKLFSLGNTHIALSKQLVGNLVTNIRRLSKMEHFERVLFVNAASPVALLGNGNDINDSADGMLGRISAISVLGWPVMNPSIQFELTPLIIKGIDLDID